MNKKKVLVFIDWFLPGYKAGGPIQSCANLIENLKDEFEFSVITRDADYCDDKPYKDIKSDEWNTLPNGTRVYYISRDKLYRKTIKKLLLSEDFDVVYLNGIYSLYFTLIPLYYFKKALSLRLAVKSSGIKVVIAARGMLAEGAISVKKTKKKLFLHSSKIIGLFNNVTFHATTEQEVNDIKLNFGLRTKIVVAPNLPKKSDLPELKPKSKEKGKLRLVNVARIAPEKGLLYALELLRNVNGKIDFDIYGPVYDEKYWEQCKKLIKLMPSNIRVNYFNSLSRDEVHKVIMDYHFMLMPTKGENYGHIIIESMSAGVPVIISDKTPWKNLKEQYAGWDLSLLIPTSFVSVLEQCIQMNNEEYLKFQQGAYALAQKVLNNKETLQKNRELFL